jgi:hypothetical protein
VYVVGTNATFSWSAVSDPDGGISGYHIVVTNGSGATNLDTTTSATTTTAVGSYGQTLYAKVSAINNAGVEGAFSPVSSGVLVLDPAADSDGDGQSNAAEVLAGTNPLDPGSVLRILSATLSPLQLTWSSVSGKTYTVMATPSLASNFTALSGVIQATAATANYTDTLATNPAKFYRVKLVP